MLRNADGGVTLIAHRGGAGPWQENTLECVRRRSLDGRRRRRVRCAPPRRTGRSSSITMLSSRTGEVIGQTKRRDLPKFVADLTAVIEACEGILMDVEIKIEQPQRARQKTQDPALMPSARGSGCGDRVARKTRVVVSSFWPDPLVLLGEMAAEDPHWAARPSSARCQRRTLDGREAGLFGAPSSSLRRDSGPGRTVPRRPVSRSGPGR